VGVLVSARYRIENLLGRGASGRVFLAHDEVIARRAVIKELHADTSGEQAVREARTASAAAHPNVVVLYDVVQRNGTTLLVQEHVSGGSLAERVERAGPLSAAEGTKILLGILEGLAAVHLAGIVHRDLKPANVLLDARGVPKVADFGIARVRSGETVGYASEAQFVGTPEFMAPEQRRGQIATFATDVYAVGALARRCIGESLPAPIEGVVGRSLKESPVDRWPDAGAMLAAFREAALRA
jgi:serine/threonine protein kinase